MLDRCEKGGPPALLVGVWIGTATVENSTDFPQRTDIEPLSDLTISVVGKYPEKMKTRIQKDTCAPMFIAALFTIAKI